MWSCIQGHQDQQWRYDDDKMTIEHLSRTIPWWAARWGLAHLFRGPSGRCAMAAQGRNGWSVRAGGGISMWPCSRTTPVVNRKFGEIMPGRTEGGSNGVGTWEFPGPPAGKDIRAALGGLTLACPGSKVLTGCVDTSYGRCVVRVLDSRCVVRLLVHHVLLYTSMGACPVVWNPWCPLIVTRVRTTN